jgi:hypothetical protein
VHLNSPRLLIRLRMCRKSGTVPLNSPRLLIRHWISFPGLHIDIHTKLQEEPTSRPTRTTYTIPTPSTTGPGTTISTTHYLILIMAIKSNDIHTLKVNPRWYIFLTNLPSYPFITRHSNNLTTPAMQFRHDINTSP